MWETTTTSARPSRLTKTEIVEAAMRIHAEDGLGMLSMRRLAAAVDASPMALYRHVTDKDEILVEVVDALLASQTPPPSETPWPEYLRAIALMLRSLLREEPIVLQLFSRRPIVTPASRRRLAAAITVLRADGFDEDSAAQAYAAVHTYTLGFCALEQARNGEHVAAAGRDGAPDGSESDPNVARIGAFVSQEQFLFGLDALIAGIPRP